MKKGENDVIVKKKKSWFSKLLRSKLAWLAVIILVASGVFAYVSFFQPPDQIEYTTEPVIKGGLSQTVSATGEVEPAQDISLNFKSAGRLAYLSVKEGDTVKSGDILARLDVAGLSAQVDQYRASVVSAEADLERIMAGASTEDVNVVEERLIKSQNDLASLKTEQDVNLKSLRDQALNSLNNAVFTAPVAMDTVYNHLLNDETTSNLYFNNTKLESMVASRYIFLKQSFAQSAELFEVANQEKSYGSVVDATESMLGLLSDLNIFLNHAYDLTDTIILNSTYTQTNKESIKTDIAGAQSSNNTALNSLQTAKSNLITTNNSYSSQIQTAENNIAIYQAELNFKKSGPRDFEIKAAQAKLSQARAQLNKVLADLGDYVIVAPIDGTVTKVNFSLGEQTNLSMPAIRLLSVESFEVKVDIPESDIAKIEIGDRAVIELDAIGSDHFFFGTIIFIDPAQTVIRDVTYYKVTVGFDGDDWNSRLKPGMSSDVVVTTAVKDDALYIPQRAVRIRESRLGEVPAKYVEVLKEMNEVEEREVVTGLRGDGGLVEILSGLQEGEQVVTFKKNGA